MSPAGVRLFSAQRWNEKSSEQRCCKCLLRGETMGNFSLLCAPCFSFYEPKHHLDRIISKWQQRQREKPGKQTALGKNFAHAQVFPWHDAALVCSEATFRFPLILSPFTRGRAAANSVLLLLIMLCLCLSWRPETFLVSSPAATKLQTIAATSANMKTIRHTLTALLLGLRCWCWSWRSSRCSSGCSLSGRQQGLYYCHMEAASCWRWQLHSGLLCWQVRQLLLPPNLSQHLNDMCVSV